MDVLRLSCKAVLGLYCHTSSTAKSICSTYFLYFRIIEGIILLSMELIGSLNSPQEVSALKTIATFGRLATHSEQFSGISVFLTQSGLPHFRFLMFAFSWPASQQPTCLENWWCHRQCQPCRLAVGVASPGKLAVPLPLPALPWRRGRDKPP